MPFPRQYLGFFEQRPPLKQLWPVISTPKRKLSVREKAHLERLKEERFERIFLLKAAYLPREVLLVPNQQQSGKLLIGSQFFLLYLCEHIGNLQIVHNF